MNSDAKQSLINFHKILIAAPDLYLILDNKFNILEVSDLYLEATMTKREEILGRGVFDVFPDNPNDPNATGVNNLSDSLNRVLKYKKSDTMAVQKYDIRKPISAGGEFEERYWSPVNAPVLDANNEVCYIIHRVQDVTEYVNLKVKESEHKKHYAELSIKSGQMGIEVYKRAQIIQETNAKLEKTIHELERKDLQIKQSEERFRLLVDGCIDYAIMFLDLNGNITTWNSGAERIYGYSADEVIGKHVSIFYSNTEIENSLPTHELHTVVNQGRCEVEGLRIRKNGEQFWVNAIITALYDDRNTLIGYAKITRDLTERKKSEKKLAKLNQQLLISAKQAGMSEVANAVLHNIGNVLNSMNTSIMLVNNNITQSASFKTLKLALDLLDEHSHNLIDYLTKDEKGKIIPGALLEIINVIDEEYAIITNEMEKLKKHTQFVADIIVQQQAFSGSSIILEKTSIEKIAEYAIINILSNSKNINIKKDFDKIPLLRTDKYKILQIIICLLQNAKDALLASDKPDKLIEFSIKILTSSTIRITIEDNGTGIKPENMNKIFSLGFTTKPQGHGCGLHNSALLARELGGKLQSKSKGEGVGSIFILDLPK